MSVKVTFLGRLGNNLFQYALGRIVAENHGLELRCERLPEPAPSFMGHNLEVGPSATIENLTFYFPNAPLYLPGRAYSEPIECFEIKPGTNWSGNLIDLQSILANRTPRQIRLAGYFQRFEYFEPYRDRIRVWFRLRPIPAPFRVAANDVLVNIRRGGDYGILGWTLSLSYYDQVLSNLRNLGKVYICGECIDNQVRRCFAKYEPIYYDGAPIEQFIFITSFSRIILSNSTFAWWAAFLSEATEIYAPRSAYGHAYGFTGYRDVDLHMREPRYREVDNASIAKFTLFVPNGNVVTSMDDESQELLIKRFDGGFTAISIDDSNRKLLLWLIQQKDPVTFAEVRRRYSGPNLKNILTELLKSGIVSLEFSYLD